MDVINIVLTEAEILADQKRYCLKKARQESAGYLLKSFGNPTQEERDTWERKRAWAKSYAGGDMTYKSHLEALCTPEERNQHDDAAQYMATKIIAKNTYAEEVISFSGGVLRVAEKAIEDASSPELCHAALENMRSALLIAS